MATPFFVRGIYGARLHSTKWSQDWFKLLWRGSIKHITNRTESPQAIWTEEDTFTFSIDDSWERELNNFCEAIFENYAIESCGIEDAVNLMRIVEKVYQ